MATYYCSPRAHWSNDCIYPPGWEGVACRPDEYHPSPFQHPTTVQSEPQPSGPIDTSKTHYRFTPTFPSVKRERMSDEDIDRIAKRVLEMLKDRL